MLARPVFGQEHSGFWRPGFKGHGTIHEQLGQLHFPEVAYEKYVSNVKYTQEREYSQMFMGPVFAFTHSLFDFLTLRNTSFLLPDYVEQTNLTIFSLGQMYEKNDWVKLLAENRFLIILWILPLLISIFIMPFIALVLFLLIIGLVLAFAIAILSHKQMIRNVGYTNERFQRGSEDICAFLKDVSRHLYHLLVTNLETLKDHISDESYEAHKHIFLDLVDTSDGNALTELEKILMNMPEAWEILAQVDQAEKNLRFYNAMYRDGLRGAKRDLILALVSLCRLKNCIDFVRDYTKIDSSKCLHIDDMPNTTVFLNAADNAIKNKLNLIPLAALQRLQEVGQTIKDTIAPVIPPILTRFDYAASQYKEEYILMNDIIEAAISDVHLRTLKSAKSFEDINEKFGPDRKLYTNIACLLLFLILIALIFSLVCGFFVRNNNTGSNCMVFAILLIFCTFSFITLVGLFHYVLGMRVVKVDGLISVREKGNFGETIIKLMDTIKRTEDFIRGRGSEFINTIGLNLTHSMEEQLQKYRNMTITEIKTNVGQCAHIAYIQDHGTTYACRTLIDPINGFWVGLLISSILFLPTLYVAHRLVCLYRSDPDLKPVVYLVRSDGVNCPTCTGAPYKPHPVVICGGGQQESCQCPLPEKKNKNLADIEVGFSKSKRE
ncbi:hypothetical protein ACLKA6_012697 [Drosophila palustris]